MTLEKVLENARRAAEGQFEKSNPRRRDLIKSWVDTAERSWLKDQREWAATHPAPAVVAKPAPKPAPAPLTIRERFEHGLKAQVANGTVSEKIAEAQIEALKKGKAKIVPVRHEAPRIAWFSLAAKEDFEDLVADEAAAAFRAKIAARCTTAPVVVKEEPKLETTVEAKPGLAIIASRPSFLGRRRNTCTSETLVAT